MSTQRVVLQVHHLYFIILGGADPVAVAVGISCSPITLAVSKVRHLRREAVLGFAAIGARARASVALGSLRSRMQRWPAQDGWYLVPVRDGRQFRRSFGAVVEHYTQTETAKAVQYLDLQDYLRRVPRRDFTFSRGVAGRSEQAEVISKV